MSKRRNKPALKPCPFCGCKDVYVTFTQGEEGWYAQCFGCFSRGAVSEDIGQIISLWNRRVGDE